ncbi:MULTISPECIES: halocyanin domain-containing protein [unclassified Haladaptatus]|uniref:halocyanin domain-containing protein n=1 Tax=unclassified Haladaptatus TaxID=2622732 RepID=UPI0023E7AC60|nr:MULTISPECIES: halocyanin domain-containing protein [unclassified Haladaptatus]
MHLTRRTYLQGMGALALVGATGLAGCGDADAQTGPFLASEPAYDGWFADVDSYKATYDRRGEPAVTVTVGAKDTMGYFEFAPVAVAVSPGTTVTWEWSGKGGAHDVVELEGAFKSPYTDHAETTFAHTFDAPGVYKYYCTPHRGMGMKGAIVVMEQ